MEVGLCLSDDSFHLVRLGEGQEDSREITEGLVQAAGLWRVAKAEPCGLESVEDGMAGLMRDDVQRTAGEDPLERTAAGLDEIAELERLLIPVIKCVHGVR